MKAVWKTEPFKIQTLQAITILIKIMVSLSHEIHKYLSIKSQADGES